MEEDDSGKENTLTYFKTYLTKEELVEVEDKLVLAKLSGPESVKQTLIDELEQFKKNPDYNLVAAFVLRLLHNKSSFFIGRPEVQLTETTWWPNNEKDEIKYLINYVLAVQYINENVLHDSLIDKAYHTLIIDTLNKKMSEYSDRNKGITDER